MLLLLPVMIINIQKKFSHWNCDRPVKSRKILPQHVAYKFPKKYNNFGFHVYTPIGIHQNTRNKYSFRYSSHSYYCLLQIFSVAVNYHQLVSFNTICMSIVVCTISLATRLGRAIAQAVSRWLPTAAARVRSQVRSCWICGGQSGTGAGFLRVLRFSLAILIPPTAP
jgi:hypothetical protein